MIAVMIFLAACQNEPLQDYQDQPLRATGNPRIEQVGNLIESLAETRHWDITRTAPGVIDAMLVRKNGKHSLAVRIEFDAKSFSIADVSSESMNYSERDGERWIHPLYNKWVGFLRRDIETRSSRL